MSSEIIYSDPQACQASISPIEPSPYILNHSYPLRNTSPPTTENKTDEPILQIFVYLQWLLSLTGTRNWNIIHCLFSWLTNCNIISSTDKICNQVVKQLTIYHDFTRVLEVSRVLSTETKSRLTLITLTVTLKYDKICSTLITKSFIQDYIGSCEN